MPELPFLEVLAENLAAGISGRRIQSVQVRQPALLQTPASPDDFAGEFLSFPSRKGKYLILECESRRAIVIHLMRLGRLHLVPPPQVPKSGGRTGQRSAPRPSAPGRSAPRPSATGPKAHSARIELDDGSALLLVEHGTEKRARLWLVEDADQVPELSALGPDPTRGELSEERFLSALRAESRQLKTFLTDQRAIAGIGNGLSDEILYEARLSPLRLTGQVDEEGARRLYAAVGSVLRRQTDLLREEMAGELPQRDPRDHYAVHDHAGSACARCQSVIARVSYADRDTFYCPGCQTGGAPLKDRRLSKLLK